MKAIGMGNRAIITPEHRMREQQPVEVGRVSKPRKIYTISVGWYEVRNVHIAASSWEKAMAKAQKDWDMDRNLDWRECPRFEPPLFQVEDEEEVGTVHEPA